MSSFRYCSEQEIESTRPGVLILQPNIVSLWSWLLSERALFKLDKSVFMRAICLKDSSVRWMETGTLIRVKWANFRKYGEFCRKSFWRETQLMSACWKTTKALCEMKWIEFRSSEVNVESVIMDLALLTEKVLFENLCSICCSFGWEHQHSTLYTMFYVLCSVLFWLFSKLMFLSVTGWNAKNCSYRCRG